MINFSALSAAWLALVAIPVITVYFLKLKRPRVDIPSLVLWQQVLSDSRVNSPFQRFRRNLLLLLQLLLLALLVLAAMQPFFVGSAGDRQRVVILLDHSASMGAMDEAEKQSRLNVAKAQIEELIDGKTDAQAFAIIAFSRTATRVAGFTDNARVLKEALATVSVEDVPSDIENALRMAQAMERSVPFDEVLLFSDGNFPERSDFNLSFELNYQKLPPAGPNWGISELNARRSGNDAWTVFVQVVATEDSEQGALLELYRDDELIDTQTVAPDEDGRQRVAFEIGAAEAATVSARLAASGFDALATDNEAFIRLAAMRPLSVYVASGLDVCRRAMSGMPTVRFVDTIDAADLLVTDEAEQLTIAGPSTRLFAGIPSELKALLTVTEASNQVVDWDRSAPILHHVELNELLLMDNIEWREADGLKAVEALGHDVLIFGSQGPLLLRRHHQGTLDYTLLFSPERSSLPYRVAFPVMLTNVVQESMKAAGIAEATAPATGVLPDLSLSPNTTYQVIAPNGDRQAVTTGETGLLVGASAPVVGKYQIADGGTQRTLGVSLLSGHESMLVGVDKIQFNELSVDTAGVAAKTDRSLWRALALLGFLVLVVEWWYFQRRAG